MASILQQEILRRSAAEIAANVVDAIRNKPIKRFTKNKGHFEGVVNASGRLAASVRWEAYETGFRVYALDYIDALIYGRKPTENSGNGSVLAEIKAWLPIKGLAHLNPYAVTSNIHKYGTSIWQEHQGKDSGLLANAINESVISKIRTELTAAFIKDTMEGVNLELKKMSA